MSLFKKLFHGEFAKFIKFGITGVANTAVDYLVFAFLTGVCGLDPYVSQVCSYSAGIINSYLVNRSWTFHSKQRFFSWQMGKFILSNFVVLIISIGLLRLFIGVLGGHIYIAKLISLIFTTILNFIISRLWVFR